MPAERKQRIPMNMQRTDIGRVEVAKLTVETYKSDRGGIVSRADVSWFYGAGIANNNCNGDFVHTFGGSNSGDWSKQVVFTAGARGTQANIDKQHDRVFTPETIAALQSDAEAFYQRTDLARYTTAKAAACCNGEVEEEDEEPGTNGNEDEEEHEDTDSLEDRGLTLGSYGS